MERRDITGRRQQSTTTEAFFYTVVITGCLWLLYWLAVG